MGTSALRLKVRCSHIYCVFYYTASIKSIKMADADAIKKICDIYDWHGKGQLDLFYLGDVIYALGFNITKKICMANGQQEEEAKKFASFDEVVTMVNAALKTPENHGNYHDYIELCKLYDKNENGTMMLADEIPKEDTLALLAELADPEDEDVFFPYTPFLDRLCGKANLVENQNNLITKKENQKIKTNQNYQISK